MPVSALAITEAAAPELAGATATYSPDDNKLRLHPSSRLDKETYDRVRAAGFSWAPKQELFVAPMWTPEREDLLLELCGEIGDEDTSLAERAEERAERFDDYSTKRAGDAENAHARVAAIADNIPLGQPILVGHHSERHARKHAEQIRSGMKKYVKLWETSQYWERRAAGALRHAKYKELPAVRHRRIKGLEADRRKHDKQRDLSEKFLKAWKRDGLTREHAMQIANYDHVRRGESSLWYLLDREEISAFDASTVAIATHARTIDRENRWIAHIDLRLAYERAMLGEQGGLVADKHTIEIGGRVLVDSKWCAVTAINRVEDRINSVSVVGHWSRTVEIEKVRDYRAPEEGDAERVKAATKLPPLINRRSEGCVEMTQAEYTRAPKDYKASRVVKGTAEFGTYRYRSIYRGGAVKPVFLTDAKAHDLPAPASAPKPTVPAPEPVIREPRAPRGKPAEAAKFEQMKGHLKLGIQIVAAPQLFPTPAPIVERMIDAAELEPHHRVLEPSAGTGAIVSALRARGVQDVLAIEVDARLASTIVARCLDFLAFEDDSGFDRIVMNPPFAHGSDIAHIEHAFELLRPGGRLIALCANGPRQTKMLKPQVEVTGGIWEELPEGSFKEQGTNVRVVLLTMNKPA